MGVDTRLAVGPFIRCKSELINDTKIRLECPNGHSIIMAYSYCPQCGSELVDKYIPSSRVKHNPQDIIRVLNETLYVAGHNNWGSNKTEHTYAPNKQYKTNYHSLIDLGSLEDQEAGAWNITPDLIKEETLEFMKVFEKEIAQLMEIYGKDNVSIEWGIVYEIW